jgi:hypothetical protein
MSERNIARRGFIAGLASAQTAVSQTGNGARKETRMKLAVG